jgi:hypothetical protein
MKKRSTLIGTIAVACCCAACGGDPTSEPIVAEPEAGPLGSSTSVSELDSAASEPDTVGTEPPSDPEALDRWMWDGSYSEWEGWSEVGSTLGSGGARVYLSASLVESIAAGNASHPVGAAAVRELYAEDFTTLVGYSALIKLGALPGADSWFCFERLSFDVGAEVHVAERGSAGCVGCHGQGSDFVRSTLPLP